MKINFKKAHQLISTLEAKLHATTTHAATAS